ncbi:hypothetical protein NPIL_181951, partial [Nephila pilipes]
WPCILFCCRQKHEIAFHFAKRPRSYQARAARLYATQTWRTQPARPAVALPSTPSPPLRFMETLLCQHHAARHTLQQLPPPCSYALPQRSMLHLLPPA